MSTLLEQLGEVHKLSEQGKVREAYRLCEKLLEEVEYGSQIYISLVNNMLLLADVIVTITSSEKKRRKWLRKCAELAEELLKLAKNSQDELLLMAIAYFILGKVNAMFGKKKRCLEYLSEAYELSVQSGNDELKRDIVELFLVVSKNNISH